MSKKQDVRNIILFVLVGLVIFGIVGYKAYNDFFNSDSPSKKLVSLDLYGYTLSKNDTDLYKDNFKALEKTLSETPINYDDYAKLLSKLFIIDVFNLNNKISSTDIGGLEFLYKPLKENFKENMGNTLYKHVQVNLDGKRTQNLPEVTSVEVTDLFPTKYTYNKKEYEAYIATVKWEYKQDLGYEKNMKLTLIKDNNIIYIVKGE